MNIYFLGDNHIKEKDDEASSLFISFLKTLQPGDKLFLMGDLFDLLLDCDDVSYSYYEDVFKALEEAAQNNIELVFLEGNHDFMLGKYFKEKLKATVYKDFLGLDVDNKKIFLTHGDLSDDSIRYRFWRLVARSFIIKFLKIILGNKLSFKIGRSFSKSSRTYNNERADAIEKLQIVWAKTLIAEDFDVVIMGHTHRSAFCELKSMNKEGSEKQGLYINTGSFTSEKTYALLKEGQITLEKFES